MHRTTATLPVRLVSFSGMDGAGKSTQIEALRQSLEAAGLQVRIITFWDEVATLTQLREVSGHKLFKGDKGIGSPERPINRRDKNVRSAPMTVVRLFLYTLDALSLRRLVKKALRSRADFIICDRYAWDELANLNLINPFVRIFVRLIAAVVPRPGVSFVLDADPVLARARKPEYPLEFLYSCRESYHRLAEIVRCLTIVPAGTVEQVKQSIQSHLDPAPRSPMANEAQRPVPSPLEEPRPAAS